MFMKETDEACNLFELCNVDCLLELMFVSVLPSYWNRKIGEDLTNASIELVRRLALGENVKTSIDGTELGLEPIPKLIAALFTSPTSQRMGVKCQFEEAARISYENLYSRGKTFASILGKDIKDTALMFKTV